MGGNPSPLSGHGSSMKIGLKTDRMLLDGVGMRMLSYGGSTASSTCVIFSLLLLEMEAYDVQQSA